MVDGSHLISYYSCQKKVRHSNRKKAKAHIKSMMKKKRKSSKHLASYKCPFCHGYHVGNKREIEDE